MRAVRRPICTGGALGAARGASLVEALAALAVMALMAGFGMTALHGVLSRQEAPLAARRVVSEVRLRRSQAASTARGLGLVFAQRADGWTVALHEDGDADGVLAADRRSGVDPCVDGPVAFDRRYGGARPGFNPRLTRLRSPPPGSRLLPDLVDPVRFGSSDTVTFNPRGQVTSGTLYITDDRDAQYAVVVYGATARLRLWQYDLEREVWRRR